MRAACVRRPSAPEGHRPSVEPYPVTVESLLPVRGELSRLEPLFALANARATREEIGRLLLPDFWEVGASGGRYRRAFVLDVLERRQREPDDGWKLVYHQGTVVQRQAACSTLASRAPSGLLESPC